MDQQRLSRMQIDLGDGEGRKLVWCERAQRLLHFVVFLRRFRVLAAETSKGKKKTSTPPPLPPSHKTSAFRSGAESLKTFQCPDAVKKRARSKKQQGGWSNSAKSFLSTSFAVSSFDQTLLKLPPPATFPTLSFPLSWKNSHTTN